MTIDSQNQRDKQILDNLVWLLAALVLAIVVWITAELDINPIVEVRMDDRIEIDIITNEDVIVTNQPTTRAFVTVRAQQSTIDELEPEDIQIFANLQGIEELGQHRVNLEGRIAESNRATIVEIVPQQITVQIEERLDRLIPLETVITDEPPANVEAQVSPLEVNQVRVSGPADMVSRIDEAQLALDLSQYTESTNLELEPILVDFTDTSPLIGITVEPETIEISVEIEERSDVREVRVTPNIVSEPPEGYTITSTPNYSPETVFVGGPPDLLESLPGTLFTTPIDLSSYTSDLEIPVSVELPDDRLVLITGQRIEVSVGIAPIQSSRQFERIPIEIIGLPEGFEAILSPTEVSVLVNGPQNVIADLSATDIQVIVDLNGIEALGTAQVVPTVSVTGGQIPDENISVLPSVIDVQLSTAAND